MMDGNRLSQTLPNNNSHATAILNVILLMKEIDTLSGTWYSAIHMANAFFQLYQKGGSEAVCIDLERRALHIHDFSLDLC